MRNFAANAVLSGRTIMLAAEAICPTGGYSFTVKEEVVERTLIVTIELTPPAPGTMVTQALTRPQLDSSVTAPEGVKRAIVVISGQPKPVGVFDLPMIGG